MFKVFHNISTTLVQILKTMCRIERVLIQPAIDTYRKEEVLRLEKQFKIELVPLRNYFLDNPWFDYTKTYISSYWASKDGVYRLEFTGDYSYNFTTNNEKWDKHD